MDPEIQPLANKVNKIEQKLEEQEQRIEMLENEEAALEQKLAIEEMINPAETILIDHGDGESLEAPIAPENKETETLAVIEHTAEPLWKKWLAAGILYPALAVILSILYLVPFVTGFGSSSLVTPILVLILDLAVAILVLFSKQLRLSAIALIGTIVVYLNWFFGSDAGVINPDLLTSFYFVMGYFVVLSSIPAVRIFWQKKRLTTSDLWLLGINSLLFYLAIIFLFRDIFIGILSILGVILLLGNSALIGYFFYNKNLQKMNYQKEVDQEKETREDEHN
jgi:hypothetical protein